MCRKLSFLDVINIYKYAFGTTSSNTHYVANDNLHELGVKINWKSHAERSKNRN